MGARKKYIILFLLYFGIPVSAQGYQIFLVTVPKSGTHLILKLLKILQTDYPTQWHYKKVNSFQHWSYRSTNRKKLLVNIKKGFVGIRDPRDVIASWCNWQKAERHEPELVKLSTDGKISLLIQGSKQILGQRWLYGDAISRPFLGIKEIYTQIMEWLQEPNFMLIRFEDLVGPQGGGSLKKQLETIKQICHHLEITLTDKEIEKTASQLFGDTPTFQGGQIGSWKLIFKEKHNQLLKEFVNELLINLGYNLW